MLEQNRQAAAAKLQETLDKAAKDLEAFNARRKKLIEEQKKQNEFCNFLFIS